MTDNWGQLKTWINQLKWKSVDRDNMVFEVRMTCYVKDELARFAASAALDPATLEAAAKVAEGWGKQSLAEAIRALAKKGE